MPVTVTGCSFSEGRKNWFSVGSNFMQYFEIGSQKGQSLWLQGDIVGPLDAEEYLFNARLFVPGNRNAGTIIDNFPKAPPPKGWHVRVALDPNGSGSLIGYDLVSQATEQTIFGYRVNGQICTVCTDLYDERGERWAQASSNTLQLLRGPALLGRGGLLLAA